MQSKNHYNRLLSSKNKHWFFIGPHLFFFLVFGIIPTVYGIYISFTRWDMTGSPDFVGLANFKEILFRQESIFYEQFWEGLKNTLLFVVISFPFMIIIPLLLAVAMSVKTKMKKLPAFFQSIFYIPGLFSISAVGLTWTLIFNKRLGPINQLFDSEVNWLTNQPYAWLVILIVTIWGGVGGNMIIYRAAIAGISDSLYEAAEIDGASVIAKFFNITIPSIRFQLLFTLIGVMAGGFNVYGQPVMMTGGGPNRTTTVLMMYIRGLAFGDSTGGRAALAGMASAMALILGIIIAVIASFQFFVLSRED